MMKHKRKLIFLLMVLLLFSSFPLDSVLADSVEDKIEPEGYQEEEIMEVHQDLDKIMKRNDGFFYNDLARKIGEWSINGLGWILEFFERGVDSIISMGNFYEMWGIKNMIDNLMPFILGLFLLTLIVVGILLMLNKIEKREELIVNILLAFSMLVILPNLFPLLDDALKDGIDHLTYNDSLKDAVVQTNVADLQMYVDAEFKYSGNGGSLPNPDKESNWNGANEVDGMKFAVNETFDMFEGEKSWWFDDTDFKDNNPNAYNVLITRTDYDGKGDETSLRLLRKNIFPGTEFGRETYYRYAVNWGTILMTLVILTVATAITVIKMARVIFDIAFHSIFGLFVAVTDVTGGQRIKKMITEIVSSFAVFFVMVLILRLFIMYANWLVGMKDSVGTIAYLLMLLGGAWALLDAPDIVQRLLGIDAGLRSAWGTMAGAYGLAKGAQGVGKGISKGIDGVAKGASGAGAFAKGALGMQPKGGGGSNMQKSPVESGGGGDGGNPPNPPSGGGGDGGNPPNPPSGGGGDDGNPPNPPSGGGRGGNSFDDPQKTMRFNLDAPNEPISSSGSGNISGSNPPSGGGNPPSGGDGGGGNPPSGGDGGGGNPPSGGGIPLSDGGGGNSFDDPQKTMRFNLDAPNEPISSSGSGNVSGSNPPSGGSDFGESYGSGMQSEFVSPTADERNPYYKPTIFGGGRRGQEVAVNRAKAYNSGLNMRRNISKAMSTGRQFKNFTIASAKYTLGMNPSKKDIDD